MGYFDASFFIQADPLNLGTFFAGNFNVTRRPQYIHGERIFRPAIFIVANDCNGFLFFIHSMHYIIISRSYIDRDEKIFYFLDGVFIILIRQLKNLFSHSFRNILACLPGILYRVKTHFLRFLFFRYIS